MNPLFENELLKTRSQFFGDSGLRLGGIAMASLLASQQRGQALSSQVHPALPELPHFAGKAKSVIYLHMNGGPSQLDTWDYKPDLAKEFNKNLPKEFLGDRITTMTSRQANFPNGSNAQALFSRMWGSGFLPGKHSGVVLSAGADPVLYLENPPGVSRKDRRTMLDALGKLNARGFNKFGDPDIQTRISQYEMAYRMQSSVPELTDLSQESASTKELYGPEVDKAGSFASSALLARRLVERGVRMVQIMHRGWDSHGNLPKELSNQCLDTDQACAAPVTDLKQRGMLDETLVVWGGEFGRTVYSQGTLTKTKYGRDHHPRNFCMWMAGGGIKGGVELGETDEYSYNPVADPVHINEINATILHCLGIDHETFTLRYQGLDQRLTGVEPMKVIKKILA